MVDNGPSIVSVRSIPLLAHQAIKLPSFTLTPPNRWTLW
jgi:hypothetical protein